MGERATLEIQGESVEVTSLSDVLFSASGFRKGEVIDYYIRIAEHLLPHLHNRPIKLKMFWDGVGKLPRDERDAPPDFLPDWMRTMLIPRAHEQANMEFVLPNDLRSVVWLVNRKNYEFHPFLATASNLKQPTVVVFDLDPGPPADVLDAARIALALKKMLDALKLKSFIKSTGSKGVHVYVPLNTPVTYGQTVAFARQVADALGCAFPDTVVAEMAKAARPGKVFVDWSQNEYFKSTVSVYSLRAVGEQPFVSAPMTWKEVAAAVKKGDASAFYILPSEQLKRARKQGDLFAPVLKLKQRLPAQLTMPGRRRAAVHRSARLNGQTL